MSVVGSMWSRCVILVFGAIIIPVQVRKIVRYKFFDLMASFRLQVIKYGM